LVYTQGNADFTKDAYEMFRKFIYLLFTQGWGCRARNIPLWWATLHTLKFLKYSEYFKWFSCSSTPH
jgi:hypothetical protein